MDKKLSNLKVGDIFQYNNIIQVDKRICGFDSHLRYYSDGHYDHAGSTPALGTISN